MSDLIDRAEVMKLLNEQCWNGMFTYFRGEHHVNCFRELVKAIPPVEKKSEWIDGNNICPKCGEDKFKGLEADIYADWQPNFCSNCGADMRKPIIDEEDIPMEYFESGGK